MLRYETTGHIVLNVDLHNGYTTVAIARWNRETGTYKVTLYLKENTTEILDMIEKAENFEFNSDVKSIKVDIANYVTTLLSEGFFKYYIQRYKYLLKCFADHDSFEEICGE